MKPLPRIVVAAATALIAQGCSNMQWSKPGADPATVSREMDECRAQALRGAAPVASARTPDARTDGRQTGAAAPASGSSERFVDQHEVVSACMLNRGYKLQPAS